MKLLVKFLTSKDSMSALERAFMVHKTGDLVTVAGGGLLIVGALTHYKGVLMIDEALVNPLKDD